MKVCEFCLHYSEEGACNLNLDLPKGMSCREFGPGIEKFCSNPKDFVSPSQIIGMATYFGFQKAELKKVRLMATMEDRARSS